MTGVPFARLFTAVMFYVGICCVVDWLLEVCHWASASNMAAAESLVGPEGVMSACAAKHERFRSRVVDAAIQQEVDQVRLGCHLWVCAILCCALLGSECARESLGVRRAAGLLQGVDAWGGGAVEVQSPHRSASA
jgi:hypothetical protein